MKILLITILFRSHFLPCVHNLPRSHNFQVLVPLQGFLIQFVPLQGLFVQYVPFSGAFCIIYAYYGAIDLSILNWLVILMASSKVPSFFCILLFQGVTSFDLIGLPCFRHILDSFVNCPTWTSIHVGVFTVGICDFVTFFVSMNASGSWFARFCKWMILWTSSSHWFVWGSRWDIVDAFQVISHRSLRIGFSPPNDWKTLSLKWQPAKWPVKTSPSRYLMIDGESKPA